MNDVNPGVAPCVMFRVVGFCGFQGVSLIKSGALVFCGSCDSRVEAMAAGLVGKMRSLGQAKYALLRFSSKRCAEYKML